MRITGGKAKGRTLSPLKGLSIRPTSDKVREAVFNIIGQDLRGLKVLDLFAGTGSYGLEALSRGALWSLFIDNSNLSIKIIRKNLALCRFDEYGFALKRDLRRGLPTGHPMFNKSFDLVFIDPPYSRGLISPVLRRFSEVEILGSPSIIVVESLIEDDLPVSVGMLKLSDTRVYGKTKIDIYTNGEI
jgi:16S rRNA (guanine966-N2)-methyltransferase